MTKHKIVKVEWHCPRIQQGYTVPHEICDSASIMTIVGFMIENTRNLTIFSSMMDGKYENIINIPDCCIVSMEVLSDNED